MKNTTDNISLKDRMITLFEENQGSIFKNDTVDVIKRRKRAFESFKSVGFPHSKIENWRNTKLKQTLSAPYNYYLEPTFK